MDQETNDKEWHDDDNWSLFYFSKRDTRWIVPKRHNVGWTFNLGHNKGALAFVAALIVPLLFVISAFVFVGVFSCR